MRGMKKFFNHRLLLVLCVVILAALCVLSIVNP